jgi:zona occludens toxin
VLKLVTGKPGDGKTSNELWAFLNAPEYKGRPKFCTPIKGFEPEKHGVIGIDHISVWQSLPEGSVIFCDEVQKYLGAFASREPPQWVQDLATHRHDGFDFILTTQDPGFIHAFPRKLCKPHVHYMRPWNMKGVRYTWDEVQNSPASRTSKKIGVSDFVTPNPKVFELYTSTVLDTHKARPPWKVILVGIFALLLLFTGLGVAVNQLLSMNEEPPAAVSSLGDISAGQLPVTGGTFAPVVEAPKGWTEKTMKPSIPGMAYTAPVYSSLTAPSDFPRVAACMYAKRTGCQCYSQQATRLDVPESACLVHVKEGSFDPWLSSRRSQQQVASAAPSEAPAVNGATGDAAKNEPRPGGAVVTVIESGKPGHLW